MTTLQPIRMSPIVARDHAGDATLMGTPTTPRAAFQQLPPPQPPRLPEEQSTKTPTRDSFAAANGKRSLNDTTNEPESLQEGSLDGHSDLGRQDSQHSNNSQSLQDVDMAGSDEEGDGSDNDSNDEQSERPSKKKKKGQRFFCTDYPPCNLSFTRSEHLARHIRKHTGERPFQCHCARRFSRLDNLRQHAQTVHVNEEIPGDSLAATGTRFQRQIRTDRVRPPGARSRASTAGSQGSHHRGHGRNLSTSSIGSTTSNASTISTMSDFGRDNVRPHSLNLSDRPSPRGGLTIDTLRASPQNAFAYHQSPSGTSTPTSYVYSNTPSSPFGSTLGSPISVSRNPGPWGDRALGRRLSVPSGTNPFQAAPGGIQGPPYLNPLTPSNSSQVSNNNSTMASPTASNYSFARGDAGSEADWRRRTWHPTTYSNYNQQRPATSGLSYSQTPDAPQPAFAPQAQVAAVQTPRLPGFETFDQISQRPVTPTRPVNAAHPETPSRPSLYSSSSDRASANPGERRGHASWDMSLHQNLTKLEIASGTPPKEPGQWGQQVMAEMQNAAMSSTQNMPNPTQQPVQAPQLIQHPSKQDFHQKGLSDIDRFPQPPQPTQQRAKRQGWYNGGFAAPQQVAHAHRPSPEDSSSSDGVPTPAGTVLEYQPTVVHANNAEAHAAPPAEPFTKLPMQSIYNAFPAPPQGIPRPSQAPRKPDTTGLDALVAAATSEGRNPLPVPR